MDQTNRPLSTLFLGIDTTRAAATSFTAWLLLASGLIGSLKVVLALFGIDADATHSLLLWHGIGEHGIDWISDWQFTQDNWLLSAVPLHFVGFMLFGAKAQVAIVSGWCIYVASAFVAAAIAWKIGAKWAATPVFLVLLHLNQYAHLRGFVSYSTSHNITNLFGLACILILVNSVGKPGSWYLVWLCILLTAGAVSDPWMLASYNLPVIATGILLSLFPPGSMRKRNGVVIAAAATASIIAVKTKLFGLLYFLPSVDMEPGTFLTMKSNWLYFLKDLGSLLDLFPFSKSNSRVSEIVSLLVVVGLFLYTVAWASRLRVAPGQAALLFGWLALLSIAGILAAFVVTDVEAQYHSARFLINIPYLSVIALGALAESVWRRASVAYRSVLGLVLCLFLATGITTNWPHIASRDLAMRDNGALDAVAFLKQNGLSYGYGSYWGGIVYGDDWPQNKPRVGGSGAYWGANVLTVSSNFELRVRPVVFQRTTGMIVFGKRPETARSWYIAEDIPAGVSEYFVIVSPDIENCQDVAICLKGLARQFGPPSRSIKKGEATVLVWSHRLIGYQLPPLRVQRNRTYFFNEFAEIPPGSGWSVLEPWGVWSEGHSASMSLDTRDLQGGDVQLMINAHALITDRHRSQRVDVSANGQPIGQLEFDAVHNGAVRSLTIPEHVAAANDRRVDIVFSIGTPMSPQDMGISRDSRKLGLGLISLEFK